MGLTKFTYAQVITENVDNLITHLKSIYSTDKLQEHSPIYNLKIEENCISFDSGGYGTYISLFQELCEHEFDNQLLMGAIDYDCQNYGYFGGYVFSSDAEDLFYVRRFFDLEVADVVVQEEDEPWNNLIFWIPVDAASIQKLSESTLKTVLQKATNNGFKFITIKEIGEAHAWDISDLEENEIFLTFDKFYEMTDFLSLDDDCISNLEFELKKHAMEIVREDIASELEWFIEEGEISFAAIDIAFDFKNFDDGYINGAKWLKWPTGTEDIKAD